MHMQGHLPAMLSFKTGRASNAHVLYSPCHNGFDNPAVQLLRFQQMLACQCVVVYPCIQLAARKRGAWC